MNEATTRDLTLDDEERNLILNLLDHALGETRVEAHRTHTPSYRTDVLHNETVIRRLIEKLRPPGN
jgi:hypothetical protein